ncbi:MAG: hypothetical protein JSW67_05395 [Candidatus Latescibacterota bacterium]|nr:MAG: hypothetical protein JSW67_05395 [Candidatus Latescibacterota bacterium]
MRLSRVPANLLLMAIVSMSSAHERGAFLAAFAAEAQGEPDPAWRHDPIWDDGAAEFAAYEVTWRRYGTLYGGSALLLLVKEPWAPDLHVKADRPRRDGYDVLKLNHVRDVATGIYRLRAGDEKLRYIFDAVPPHQLLLFRQSNGTEYRLSKSQRIPYWQMHDPGDEAWWPESMP